MRDDDLERALGGEPDIVPSSGFVHAVMSAVHRDADAPAPIPFPWGRALTGAILAIITALIVYARADQSRSAPPEALQPAIDAVLGLGQNRDLWAIAGALLLTVVIVDIPRRFFIRTH